MTHSEKKLTHLLSVAREAASLAGAFLIGGNRSNTRINKEKGRDIKIKADIRSERIILKFLNKNSRFSILSEENGFVKGADDGFMWIVDPLDGSFNYMRGIPISCVSVGLWRFNKPVLGAVYDFNRAELFSGIAGKGAWLNGSRIKVSAVSEKERAVLCTGFPVNTDFTKKNLEAHTKNVRLYKKTRLLGSAALSIAYVACGRADAYHEDKIMLWDIAGAIPVLAGAGGKFNMKESFTRYAYFVHASNGHF
ncbi:MAG: inositol monophosphatase [Candidatus Omnitrophica bacterium]|nr:inositol monophosphatase [Candidatus Omnitrophota bacterium]